MSVVDKNRSYENEMGKGQTTAASAARKRGRPAGPPEEVKRHALGIRTTKKLKNLLQRAADSSGRSVAQEIEFRLEQSFSLESLLGRQEALLPAVAFELSGKHRAAATGHPAADWWNDQFSYEEAITATVETLWLQHPADGWSQRRHWLQRLLGRLVAPYRKTLSDEDLTIKPSAVDLSAPVGRS
jgi:hypothetical protein